MLSPLTPGSLTLLLGFSTAQPWTLMSQSLVPSTQSLGARPPVTPAHLPSPAPLPLLGFHVGSNRRSKVRVTGTELVFPTQLPVLHLGKWCPCPSGF